jgi:hypothetical protein
MNQLDKASIVQEGHVFYTFPDAYTRGREFFVGEFIEPPAQRLDRYLKLADDGTVNVSELRRLAEQWLARASEGSSVDFSSEDRYLRADGRSSRIDVNIFGRLRRFFGFHGPRSS